MSDYQHEFRNNPPQGMPMHIARPTIAEESFTKTIIDLTAQLAAANAQIEAFTVDRDDWERLAKERGVESESQRLIREAATALRKHPDTDRLALITQLEAQIEALRTAGDALAVAEGLNVTLKFVGDQVSLCWKGDYDSISDSELRAEVLRWLAALDAIAKPGGD